MAKFNSSLVTLLLALVAFSFPAVSQTPTKSGIEQTKAEYVALLQKLKKGSPDANFGQLRRAFVEWKRSGGKPEPHPKRADMVKAIQANNHEEAVKLAEEVIDSEFYNHNLFGAISDSYKALNNKKQADYYNDLFHRAQHGVFLSGDGKTAETAFYVVSIPEEYRVMNELGFKVTVQSLAVINGQAYDILSGKDSKGNNVEVYFNICFFFSCETK